MQVNPEAFELSDGKPPNPAVRRYVVKGMDCTESDSRVMSRVVLVKGLPKLNERQKRDGGMWRCERLVAKPISRDTIEVDAEFVKVG
jgi:hypothetical protein